MTLELYSSDIAIVMRLPAYHLIDSIPVRGPGNCCSSCHMSRRYPYRLGLGATMLWLHSWNLRWLLWNA